ncbi:uncharacterized protein LOC115982094 [Quercus lobata]|uniref:uncharacterized protein LOC115982094 n=1 Tax=Quercus lobata TaxID=97700 RepID=UPI0012482685|nr:uncharacterized protein LOC115982094 [Quercus lobata]
MENFLVQHMKTNINMEDGIQGHLFAGHNFLDKGKPVLNEPPLSQSDSAFLEPKSPEEAQVALLLARSNLLITRDIEWANLMLGFEQIDGTLMAPDGFEAWSPKTSVQGSLNFISIRGCYCTGLVL